MTSRQWEEYKRAFGEEYAKFLLVRHSPPPRECPICQTQTICMLWLGDPNDVVEGRVWGKWYLWCENCLKGIRCPLGSHRVPEGESYIRWGDEEALKQALPPGLRLILPEGAGETDETKKDLEERFHPKGSREDQESDP